MAVERRKLLPKLLKKAPDNIRFSKELRGGPKRALRALRQFQLEGLIAKRPDSASASPASWCTAGRATDAHIRPHGVGILCAASSQDNRSEKNRSNHPT
jgi:hypothetical protein